MAAVAILYGVQAVCRRHLKPAAADTVSDGKFSQVRTILPAEGVGWGRTRFWMTRKDAFLGFRPIG
jgi:hypothetical protein